MIIIILDSEDFNICWYILELCLIDYEMNLHYSYELSAASIYLVQKMKHNKRFNPKLKKIFELKQIKITTISK
jgi:hypothetical protein